MKMKAKKIAVRVSAVLSAVLLVALCVLPAFALESDFVEEAVNEATIKNYIYAGYYLYEYSSPLRHLMERSSFFSAFTPYLYEFETAKVGKLFDETPFISYESMSGGLSDVCVYSKTSKSFAIISDVYFKVHHTTQSGSKWVYFDIMNSTGAREQRIRFKLDQTTLELLSVELSGYVSGAGSDFIIGVVSTQFDRLILDYGFSESFFKGSSIYWVQYQDGLKGGYYQGYMNGYDGGYNTGYDEGETVGWESGYTEGETSGYNSGYREGETNGYNQGYELGSSETYTKAYQAGKEYGFEEGKIQGEAVGYEKGKTDGYREGETQGEAVGYKKGKTDGYGEGYDAGVTVGFNSGKTHSYNEGYNDGMSQTSFMNVITAIFEAPMTFVDGVLSFEILGVDMATAVRVLMSMAILAVVITIVWKAVK